MAGTSKDFQLSSEQKRVTNILSAEEHRRVRNASAIFAAITLFLGASFHSANTPEKKSAYALHQEFFRAAVHEQINDQSAKIQANALDQALALDRAGEKAGTIPFSVQGTVDIAKVNESLPEKHKAYEDKTAAQITQRNFISGILGLFALMQIFRVVGHHRAMKKGLDREGPPPAP